MIPTDAWSPRPARPRSRPAKPPRRDPEMSATWDQLDEGAAAPRREYGPLTRTDFVRYQGASGDFNPIHHDETFAKSAGFDTVFSVGMLQAGLLATYCTDLFGPSNVRRFKVQFREQVWPDDVLTAYGR